MKVRIVAIVEGGCLQTVFVNKDVEAEVELLDLDCDDEEEYDAAIKAGKEVGNDSNMKEIF